MEKNIQQCLEMPSSVNDIELFKGFISAGIACSIMEKYFSVVLIQTGTEQTVLSMLAVLLG